MKIYLDLDDLVLLLRIKCWLRIHDQEDLLRIWPLLQEDPTSIRKLPLKKNQEDSCFTRKTHPLISLEILYGLAGEEAMNQEETQLYNRAGTMENIKAK